MINAHGTGQWYSIEELEFLWEWPTEFSCNEIKVSNEIIGCVDIMYTISKTNAVLYY